MEKHGHLPCSAADNQKACQRAYVSTSSGHNSDRDRAAARAARTDRGRAMMGV
ncbi:hypothetical protein [Streptomyces sp. 7N604]|uniref:hypothetical protein n=1 Tax=Streptomyces sp. 7N604 TaxID=3457415 RepID=UPI003FD67701